MPAEPLSNRRLSGVVEPTQPTTLTSKQAGEPTVSGFWASLTNAVDSLGSVAANGFENAQRIAFATRNFNNPNLYQNPDGVLPNDDERLAMARGSSASSFLDGETAGIPNTVLLIGAGLAVAVIALR